MIRCSGCGETFPADSNGEGLEFQEHARVCPGTSPRELSPLERQVNRGVLEHAAGTAMFCPAKGCGRVLDARRTTAIFKHDRLLAVGCSSCVDPLIAMGEPWPAGVEVLRGADLW